MSNPHQCTNSVGPPDSPLNQTSTSVAEFNSFHPPLYLRNSHVQTLSGAYWFGRRASRFLDPSIKTVRGEVELADGDRLVFHDDCPADWRSGDRVVVLLHGLSGSHASPYMVRTVGKLNQLNVRTFRLDWRGSGAGISLARYPYHSGRSEDLRSAIEIINRRCPGSPLAIVGYSMGGNVALKYLGEPGSVLHKDSMVQRAVSICPPIDLSRTIRSIQTGLARHYNRYFAKSCVRDVRRRKELFPDAIIPDGWLSRPPREMWEFDDTFTAPVCGFASAEDYYSKSSANQFLPNIQVPTLIIAAQDDPLIPFGQFQDAALSEASQLCAPKYGGHLGFVTSLGPEWLDNQIIQWTMKSD